MNFKEYEKLLIEIEKKIKDIINSKPKRYRYYTTKKLYSSFENLECRKNNKTRYITLSKSQGKELQIKAREINLLTNYGEIPYYEYNKLKEDLNNLKP